MATKSAKTSRAKDPKGKTASITSKPVKRALPREIQPVFEGHLVTIKLTPEQQGALEKMTSAKIKELQIAVQDLVDLSDVVVN